MKHIKLYEEFVNEASKKDLKKLADDIASKISSLPEFKKFKKSNNKVEINADFLDQNISGNRLDASNIGTFSWKYISNLKKDQQSTNSVYSNANQSVKLFSLVYTKSQEYRNSMTKQLRVVFSHFQIMVGDDVNSISVKMPMILPDGEELGASGSTAPLFIGELNKALNSPEFVKLIKKYEASAVLI